MKAIVTYFVRNPVAAIVLHVVILIIGLRAAFLLPIVQYPLFESSSLVITTNYVGASAETVRGFISTPIERAVSATPGLDFVESKSIAGVSTVTAKLELGVDGNRALAEVANRLDQIANEIPEEAEPPRVEVQRGDRPWATFYLAFTSSTLTMSELSEYISRDVQAALAGIPGVQRITPLGHTPRAMRVWLDSSRMAAVGLDASDVSSALQRNNFVAAIGQARGDSILINLLANTNLTGVQDFRDMIVSRSVSQGTIRLSDVAKVEMAAEEKLVDARVDEKPAVYLEVWPLAGVSELSVDSELQKRVAQLKSALPPGVELTIAYNATSYMRDSLVEVSKTLAETVLIIAIVVFLFLGSFRAALVPLAAVPLSLIGTAALMSLMGMSLNLLTLLAIVLSIGLVVDDAIVVIENVQRNIKAGMSRIDAAILSISQLAAPIFAMTITLAAVYAPIGFLSGLSGVLLREFAFTLACAVLMSGLVALTLSPVMSAWASNHGQQEGLIGRTMSGAIDRVTQAYARLLAIALTARKPILAGALFVSLLIPGLYAFSTRELAPVEDQGEIDFTASGGPSATLEYMGERHIGTIVEKLKPIPGSDYVWLWAQPSFTVAAIMMKPWQEREQSTQELLGPAYEAVASIPGLQMYPFLPPALPTGGWFDVEMVVAGAADPADMDRYAQQLIAAAMESGKFLFADTDLRIDMPVSRIEIDRNRVSELGLDLETVGRSLGTMVGGDYVNRFDYKGRSYKVVPQLGEADRVSPEQLLQLRVRTPTGEIIPLSSLARVVRDVEPRSLNRFQQIDSFRIQGGAAPGVSKDDALKVLEASAAAILPPDMRIDYAGESRQLRRQGNDVIWMGALGVALIYLILALQFRGFRDPLVVLLGSVPLGLASALFLTFFDVTSINLYSQIGLVTMTGLIAKNGILIVEFANHLRDAGASRAEAVRKAVIERLRPVLMTTVATVVGHFPLTLVSGPGSAARNSIGLILVCGMALGTLFTLFVLPCVYSVLAKRGSAERTEHGG